MLTRKLRQKVLEVIGIDLSAAAVELARSHPAAIDIIYLEGDLLTITLEPESFDMVCCVATLHHLEATSAILRMRRLVRPGGTLGIVGLARSGLLDAPRNAAGRIASMWRVRRRAWHEPPTRVHWPPPESYADMQRIVKQLLPEAEFRRRLFARYTVIWRKPVASMR
jgi:SAM-dependent methyltransferase